MFWPVNYLRSVKYFSTILVMMILVTSSFGIATINDFSGYSDASRIIIQWNTSAEQGLVGFEVQRSTDGHTFFEIGFLHAQGQGSGYTFIDDSIIAKVAGRNYFYRLKIKDMGGSSQLSDVITIQSTLDVVPRTWGSLKALFK
ncbi:MAG: hypothetical protein H8E26_14380 [FCB group bacterium]|nr:hypothetical protein [FCB group bacterium]MBL7027472.1 hypothetical protein [Candidatus Neomarinimicrobiota bacterium]MBL7122085.1 hypothetical protein [Candidatus Neomarinimicrobiota bacterium]